MPSTTRAAARRALGHELGGYFYGPAFSGSTTTISTTIPAFYSSELEDDALAYAWVYLPDGTLPRLRRVTRTGVNGATTVITVDAPFGTSVTNGTMFELSLLLPPSRDHTAGRGETTELGLNEALNLGARHLVVRRDDMRLDLVSHQHDYGTDDWTWLDRPSRLTDVREPNATGTTFRPTRREWEFREGGSSSEIHFVQPWRFTTGSHEIQLVGLCPADRYVKRGGSWIDTIGGYVNETDELALDTVPLVTAGLYFCYRALRDMSTGSARADYARKAVEQLGEVRKLRAYDFTNDIDRSEGDYAGALAAAAQDGNPTAMTMQRAA